jgi:hypothetical protein
MKTSLESVLVTGFPLIDVAAVAEADYQRTADHLLADAAANENSSQKQAVRTFNDTILPQCARSGLAMRVAGVKSRSQQRVKIKRLQQALSLKLCIALSLTSALHVYSGYDNDQPTLFRIRPKRRQQLNNYFVYFMHT